MSAARLLQLPAALAVAAAIHLGLLVALTWPDEHGSATSFGTGGVTVSLGPAGRAPGSLPSEPVAVEPEVEPPEPVEPVRESATTAAALRESPAPETAEEAMDLPALAREPGPVAAEEPHRVAPIETASAAPPVLVEEVIERPVEAAAIEPGPVDETLQPVDEPTPVQVARAVPDPPLPPRRPDAPAERPATTPAPAQPPGQGGVSGSAAEADSGSGDTTSGGGAVGGSADYDALLRAWVERYRIYPRRAQIQQRQGVVRIQFVIDGDGALISYAIERSSGHAILDHAGLETIRRAAPMPRPPPEMLASGRLETAVPIRFNMQ